jgi:hypothetical protein
MVASAAIAGGDEEAGVGRVLAAAEIAEELESVPAGLGQITEHQLWAMLDGKFQPRGGIPGFEHGPLPFFEPGNNRRTKVAIIIYDQGRIHAVRTQ